jgi:hypothetical protein
MVLQIRRRFGRTAYGKGADSSGDEMRGEHLGKTTSGKYI